MSNLVKAVFVAGILFAGASASSAATQVQAPHDRAFQSIHLDNPAVPAKQYFEEMQRDGN